MSFHVPDGYRDVTHPIFGSTSADGNNGAFHVPSPEPGWILALICSDDADPDVPWEHVSVHAYRGKGSTQRTPSWKEMHYIKTLCWDDEDVVMQLHPRKSEYVNNHPHTLHLWRPTRTTIPTPPRSTV
jgi:hypothetical protein